MRRNGGRPRPLPRATTVCPTPTTALVVRDEMLFRLEVCDHPEAGSCEVVEAGIAAPALERLDGAVALTVTDGRMPGSVDGLAPAREVVLRRPDAALVAVSAQMTPRPGDLPGGVPFVARPFLESHLREAVLRVAARRAGRIPALRDALRQRAALTFG